MKKYFIPIVVIVAFFSFLPTVFAASNPGDACSANTPCTGQYQGNNLTCINNYCGVACTIAATASIPNCPECINGACSSAAYAGNACDPNQGGCLNGLVCSNGQCATSGTGGSQTPSNGNSNPTTQSNGNANPTTQSNGNTGTSVVTLLNPLGAGTNIQTLLNEILAFVVRIGAIVVIFMLIWVGWTYVKARGNPGEISKAHQALLWTIVGALILLGAQVIALGIQATVQSLSNGGGASSSIPGGTGNPYFPGAGTVGGGGTGNTGGTITNPGTPAPKPITGPVAAPAGAKSSPSTSSPSASSASKSAAKAGSTTCPAGGTYDATTKDCASCPNGGTYNAASDSCDSCPSGQTYDPTTKDCASCPNGGTYDPSTDSCSSSSSDTCSELDSDGVTYSTDPNNPDQCLAANNGCPAGSTFNPATNDCGGAGSDCTDVGCSDGFTCVNNTCVSDGGGLDTTSSCLCNDGSDCPDGNYDECSSSSSCTCDDGSACPDGSYSECLSQSDSGGDGSSCTCSYDGSPCPDGADQSGCPVPGCTVQGDPNYDSAATVDDGSCAGTGSDSGGSYDSGD